MNYEKIYKKLKPILKDELQMCKKFKAHCDCERIRNDGEINLLKWLLNECIPELEGRKWNNIFFNRFEFKEWQKEIKK